MEAVIERIHIRLASLNSWRRLDCRNCVYREYTWVKKSVLLVIVALVNFLTIGLVGICLYLYKLKGLRLVDNNSENLFKRAVESNGGFKAWMNEGEFVVKGEIEKERDGISDEKC